MMIKKPLMTCLYCMEKMRLKRMKDRDFVKYAFYRINDGLELNLESPTTFNDYLNWSKIHDHNPQYTTMADKYKVKQFVSERIGRDYVVPLINDAYGGVYKSFDQIDFDKLPDQFVLKTNHDCGGVVICTDKSKFDIEKTRKEFEKRLRTNYFWGGREWVYREIRPLIICEEYVENISDNNYKFFCFGGEVKAVYVAPYREKTVDYFDADYNHLDISTRLHQCAAFPPAKPDCYEEMKRIAEKLSEDVSHVRVDLYETCGKIYFGELTFYHEAGFVPFIPDKWNKVFGDWMAIKSVQI